MRNNLKIIRGNIPLDPILMIHSMPIRDRTPESDSYKGVLENVSHQSITVYHFHLRIAFGFPVTQYTSLTNYLTCSIQPIVARFQQPQNESYRLFATADRLQVFSGMGIKAALTGCW